MCCAVGTPGAGVSGIPIPNAALSTSVPAIGTKCRTGQRSAQCTSGGDRIPVNRSDPRRNCPTGWSTQSTQHRRHAPQTHCVAAPPECRRFVGGIISVPVRQLYPASSAGADDCRSAARILVGIRRGAADLLARYLERPDCRPRKRPLGLGTLANPHYLANGRRAAGPGEDSVIASGCRLREAGCPGDTGGCRVVGDDECGQYCRRGTDAHSRMAFTDGSAPAASAHHRWSVRRRPPRRCRRRPRDRHAARQSIFSVPPRWRHVDGR